MAIREDGKQTRLKILGAACEIFAERGYQAARVADICQRAGANVASVNYYFGDKASLYREAWQYALEYFQAQAVLDVSTDAPQDALRDYIKTLMHHFSATGEKGHFSRLYLMEVVHPTGLIPEAWHDMIASRRRALHEIIRAVIGSKTDELTVRFCEQSIINQCRALLTIKPDDLEYMLARPLSPDLIDRFADHIAEFSLAGIEAAGRPKPG